jgi:hypothetical protein
MFVLLLLGQAFTRCPRKAPVPAGAEQATKANQEKLDTFKKAATACLEAQPGASAAGPAKQLSNPVARLVRVPFQFNWDQPVGP